MLKKLEILEKSKESSRYLDQDARKFAAMALTDEQITEFRMQMAKTGKFFTKFFAVLWVLGIASICLWVFSSTLLDNLDHSSWDAGLRPALALGLGSLWSFASYSARDAVVFSPMNLRSQQLLRPISGTFLREEALKLLKKGGPLVAQWRDIALAEQRQLREYDYRVMAVLEPLMCL